MSLLPVPPVSWKSVPAWAVLKSREAFGPTDLPLLSMSAAFGVRLRPAGEGRAPSEDRSGYRVVEPGDLVINKLSARDGAVAVSALAGIVSPAYWVLQPDQIEVVPAYLHHLLRSHLYLAELARRSKFMPPAQFDLPWEQFRTLPLHLPPVEDQRRIADFLDEQVALLDRAVELRKRQISALRQAFWSWLLGQVAAEAAPALPLRRALDFVADGPFGSAFSSSDYVAEGPAVVRLGNIGFAEYRDVDQKRVPESIYSSFPRCQVRAGDLLIASLGDANNHAGRACVAPEGLEPAMVKGKSLCARVRTDKANARFLALLMSSPLGADLFQLETRGSTRNMINIEILKSVRLPLPPVERQALLAMTAAVRRLEYQHQVELGQRGVALLQERKQALITAAVTGQLDVTTARSAA